MIKKIFFSFLLITCYSSLFAAEAVYTFNTPEQQERFQSLTTELRCLVCQNQNIAESNAALANDLREQIHQQILQGQSDKKIVEYLVARYGDFILYRPPFTLFTLFLWLGPLFVLITSIGYFFHYLRKKREE